MGTLSRDRIGALLRPYLEGDVPGMLDGHHATQADLEAVYEKVSLYLDLLVRWNQKMNLTAVREPELMVERHFGESLFAARVLGGVLQDGATVLDYGSGAGFPGLPIQIFLPKLEVTLAESQAKKASFLREAVRVTGTRASVWAERVEEFPASVAFEAVVMRAVDVPAVALAGARGRVRPGGWLLVLASRDGNDEGVIRVPGKNAGVVRLERL